MLPIHFVVECGWSSPVHRASSERCCSLWTKIRWLSPNRSGRQSANDSIVGFLLDSTTDKMRGAVKPWPAGWPTKSAGPSRQVPSRATRRRSALWFSARSYWLGRSASFLFWRLARSWSFCDNNAKTDLNGVANRSDRLPQRGWKRQHPGSNCY